MTHDTCTLCTLCYSGTSGVMKGQETDDKNVRHNKVSLYQGSLPYILSLLGLGI